MMGVNSRYLAASRSGEAQPQPTHELLSSTIRPNLLLSTGDNDLANATASIGCSGANNGLPCTFR
jgi:hypothetical protein